MGSLTTGKVFSFCNLLRNWLDFFDTIDRVTEGSLACVAAAAVAATAVVVVEVLAGFFCFVKNRGSPNLLDFLTGGAWNEWFEVVEAGDVSGVS